MRLHRSLTLASVLVALCAAAPAGASPVGPGLVAEPNPDQQVVTSKPASASPVRAAVPAVQPNPDEQVPAGAPASRGVPIPAGYGTVGPPRVIVRVSAPSGFDWGDAGIGAASGIGVSMLGFAAALAVSQRRTRHQRDAAAATS